MRAGIDDREGVQVFNVIGGYIMGVVMMEVGAMFSAGTTRGHRVDLQRSTRSSPTTPSPTSSRPTACRASSPRCPTSPSCDPDEQFEFGLDLLLAGIQARVVAPG